MEQILAKLADVGHGDGGAGGGSVAVDEDGSMVGRVRRELESCSFEKSAGLKSYASCPLGGSTERVVETRVDDFTMSASSLREQQTVSVMTVID